MTYAPAKNTNPKKRWRFFAVAFLALFLAVTIPVEKVHAQQPVYDVGDSGNWFTNLLHQVQQISWLTTIAGFINDLLTHITSVLTPVTQAAASANAAATVGGDKTLASVIMDGNTFTAQSNGYNMQTAQAADNQRKATMSMKSSACAVNRVGGAQEQLGQRSYLGGAFAPIANAECHGSNASCDAPGHASEQVNDFCQLGFITQTQYGSLKQNCPASQSQLYMGGPNLEDFMNNPMMPLATPCILPDGYPSFSGPPPNSTVQCQNSGWQAPTYNQDPTQSSLAWVNAFKVCELMSDMMTPSVFGLNRAPTGNDDSLIRDDIALTSLRASDRNECLHALWERTACPANSAQAAQAVGGSSSCHDDQVALCNAIKTDPNPSNSDIPANSGTATYPSDSGLGINDNQYLNQCDQNGLSPMMAKKILAYRCNSINYVQNILPNILGSTHEVEHFMQSDCESLKAAYQKMLDDEDTRMATLLRNAWIMRASRLNGNETTNLH